MFDLTTLREPIVQAPLAGGPSTPQLAIAVCEAGGLGFIASGYKHAEAVREEIAKLRAETAQPFGVNIFVPTATQPDPEALCAYLEEIRPEAQRLGVELGEPRHDDDDWEAKLGLVCEEGVDVVSFTFGCPHRAVVERLHGRGIAVWITITNREEALAAHAVGADALIAQGSEAGGHRGGFNDSEEPTDPGDRAARAPAPRRPRRSDAANCQRGHRRWGRARSGTLRRRGRCRHRKRADAHPRGGHHRGPEGADDSTHPHRAHARVQRPARK